MSTLTVELPEEDLLFLQQWTQDKGTSVAAWMARYAKSLRENTARDIHPDVKALIGILPADLDLEADYGAYLEKKYCR